MAINIGGTIVNDKVVGGTNIERLDVGSKRAGLVLAGDKAVFADFENGYDKTTSWDLINLNEQPIKQFYVKKKTFYNVYNVCMDYTSSLYGEGGPYPADVAVSLRVFFSDTYSCEVKIIFHYGAYAQTSENYIEFNYYSNGVPTNRKTYSYITSDDGVGNKFGFRLLNTLNPQWYFQKSGAQSITATGMFTSNAQTDSSYFKDGHPKVEVWVLKEFAFSNLHTCDININVKHYQNQNTFN